jgi:predicted nucleic acid-binding protein
MRIVLDTNILVRLSDASSAHHLLTKKAVDDLLADEADLLLCTQVMIEFWAVATRPKDANGLGMSIEKASATLRDYESMTQFLPEASGVASGWRTLVEKYGIKGKSAHDARIVALMLEHNVTEILTINVTDFESFPEITTHSPLPVQEDSMSSEG